MKKRVSLVNSIRGYLKQEGVQRPAKFFSSQDWQDKLNKIEVGRVQKITVENFMFALEQLQIAEESILQEVYKIEDPRLELLESIPSIGPITSRVLLSGLDDISRFDDKKSVAKYGALTPRIYQSGNKSIVGRLSNDGRKEMRRCLLQCSHTINRMKNNASAKPLHEFSERIATARKILTVAYGALKNGEFYDPEMLKPKAA